MRYGKTIIEKTIPALANGHPHDPSNCGCKLCLRNELAQNPLMTCLGCFHKPCECQSDMGWGHYKNFRCKKCRAFEHMTYFPADDWKKVIQGFINGGGVIDLSDPYYEIQKLLEQRKDVTDEIENNWSAMNLEGDGDPLEFDTKKEKEDDEKYKKYLLGEKKKIDKQIAELQHKMVERFR